MDKDNLINPILKPENDQGNWKQWQKDLPNQFLNMDNSKKDDPVNHPSHYTDGKIEVIDFIEDKKVHHKKIAEFFDISVEELLDDVPSKEKTVYDMIEKLSKDERLNLIVYIANSLEGAK